MFHPVLRVVLSVLAAVGAWLSGIWIGAPGLWVGAMMAAVGGGLLWFCDDTLDGARKGTLVTRDDESGFVTRPVKRSESGHAIGPMLVLQTVATLAAAAGALAFAAGLWTP